MNKIAIFGGTFNPIHLGHLLIAEEVYNKLKLKKVIFMPSYSPPHKKTENLATVRDRFNMVRLALASNSHFAVSDLEIKRKGKSYTIDTIQELRRRYKNDPRLMFIIGSDSLSELKEWKEIKKILKMVKFIVVNRPGFNFNYPPNDSLKLMIPGIDISSSQIRQRVKLGISIQYLVPEVVRKYINKKGLYRKK